MTDNTKDTYKDSVFLPSTEFPMRGDLPKKEPGMIAGWQEQDLYAQMRKAQADNEPWILHDGPPYANGNLHMGHALNKILKDVIIKSNAMTGKRSPYVPGWDCHGLPIEWKIEEKYREAGKDKDAIDIFEFRAECRAFARDWVEKQSAQFQRLGVSGDWNNPYLTMDFAAEAQIAREIHKFALNGLLYQGAKPVMWSVVEQTALAEAEVEYKEHKSVTIWVRFPVLSTDLDILQGSDLVIWTTTPWTIPQNRAMAYGADIEYGVYEITAIAEDAKIEVGAKIALACSLVDDVMKQAKAEDYTCIGTFKGAELAGTLARHPLAQIDDYYGAFQVPLLDGDYVTDDAGTGFVHIAPSHGEDDFNLVVEANKMRSDDEKIEITDNITDDGIYRPHVALFAGMEVYTQDGKLGGGNFAVLKALTEAGKLLAKGSLRHEYPHSWRSKAPLIFRTTPQWFIAMDRAAKGQNQTLREQALAAISDTNWYPGKGETRIRSMIENRPDWCISRQRAWGVPIALFVHKDTGETLIDADVFTRITDAFAEEGADAWWKDGATQRFLEGTSYNPQDYKQIFDIVDVWFESGSTHSFVLGNTDKWPDFKGISQTPDGAPKANMYLEGSDQHRGWFHSSLLESCGTKGCAPYDHVLTHGFVLDEKGYKMSKSLGNVVDPQDIMNQYGADILRLWVMTSDYSEDIRIGKDTLKNTADLYRRIRNTLRFILGALDGITAQEAKLPNDLPELERLALHRLYEMDQALRGAIQAQDYGRMAKMIHDYCNEDLSAFYFDIRKDSLYCDGIDMPRRRACRAVLVQIFSCLTAWLAPILSFTAEEAWGYAPQGLFDEVSSVHLRSFPAISAEWKNEDLATKWISVKRIRKSVTEAIEPLRASKELGSSLEAAPALTLDEQDSALVQNLDLSEICITAPISVKTGNAMTVSIAKASGGKCARCWQVLEEVNDASPICKRCNEALSNAASKAA